MFFVIQTESSGAVDWCVDFEERQHAVEYLVKTFFLIVADRIDDGDGGEAEQEFVEAYLRALETGHWEGAFDAMDGVLADLEHFEAPLLIEGVHTSTRVGLQALLERAEDHGVERAKSALTSINEYIERMDSEAADDYDDDADEDDEDDDSDGDDADEPDIDEDEDDEEEDPEDDDEDDSDDDEEDDDDEEAFD